MTGIISFIPSVLKLRNELVWCKCKVIPKQEMKVYEGVQVQLH